MTRRPLILNTCTLFRGIAQIFLLRQLHLKRVTADCYDYYDYYLPLTVTLVIKLISFPSPTLSFIPDIKPSFSANPSHCSLFSSSELTRPT